MARFVSFIQRAQDEADDMQLYIIDMGAMRVTQSRAKATLHSLSRALAAYPDRASLPNIEFVFSTEDFVADTNVAVWSYSKREEDSNVWLMPDFGYWSWPEVQIGPYGAIRQRIRSVDADLPFAKKKKQLLWRGSLSTNPQVRAKFLHSAASESWGSVRVLDWDDETDLHYNLLPMEDHCRTMFLAHTEGRSFSGRGKYLLNCHSVVISHPLTWKEMHHAAMVSSGPDANYVEVAHDFSDLGRKIEFLVDHPDVAERIADNAVKTFRDRYLTPAAESCYWRELVRAYGSVSEFEPALGENKNGQTRKLRGTPFETWVLAGG